MFGKAYETTIKVKGMMCEHCAAHVNDALSKIDGVKKVKIDLSSATALIKSNRELSEEELSKAIADAGYNYEGKVQ